MDLLPEDAWEVCLGRPAAGVRSGRWGAAAAATTLVPELNKRLTALAIAVNLVMYLPAATSDVVVNDLMGISFVLMLCLLGGGGFVAGSSLRSYRTIPIFVAIQTSGVAMLIISTAAGMLWPVTCASWPGTQLVVVFLALFLTALGTGGLKSSVSGFVSDNKFDETGCGKESSQMTTFFKCLFFFISVGSMLAVTVLVYVQDTLGRPWGGAAAIAAGFVVFLAGTHSRYRFRKLTHTIAAAAAWKKSRVAVDLTTDPSMLCEEGSTKKGHIEHALTEDDGAALLCSDHGRKVMATGFVIALFAVSFGICFGGYALLLLSLPGILAGVVLIAVGVQMTDDPTAFGTTTFPWISQLTIRLRRNLAVVGLVVASSAITEITGKASPALCLSLFASLLAGIALITAGALGA